MNSAENIDASKLERRSRTISWVPLAAQRAFVRQLRAHGVTPEQIGAAILSGAMPAMPAWDFVGIRVVESGDGKAVCEMEPGEELANGIGSVQGGILCTLIDAAISSAELSVRPPGTFGATLELKVNYIRPVPIEAGAIRCEADVEYAGQQTAVIRARVLSSAGKLCASAVATILFTAQSAQQERVAQQVGQPPAGQ
jgi:uncharacterized protein (TIGR00369 family)